MFKIEITDFNNTQSQNSDARFNSQVLKKQSYGHNISYTKVESTKEILTKW